MQENTKRKSNRTYLWRNNHLWTDRCAHGWAHPDQDTNPLKTQYLLSSKFTADSNFVRYITRINKLIKTWFTKFNKNLKIIWWKLVINSMMDNVKKRDILKSIGRDKTRLEGNVNLYFIQCIKGFMGYSMDNHQLGSWTSVELKYQTLYRPFRSWRQRFCAISRCTKKD